MEYEWLKSVAEISDDLTSIEFYDKFNEIMQNSFLENLTSLLVFILIKKKNQIVYLKI